MEQQKQSGLSS